MHLNESACSADPSECNKLINGEWNVIMHVYLILACALTLLCTQWKNLDYLFWIAQFDSPATHAHAKSTHKKCDS